MPSYFGDIAKAAKGASARAITAPRHRILRPRAPIPPRMPPTVRPRPPFPPLRPAHRQRQLRQQGVPRRQERRRRAQDQRQPRAEGGAGDPTGTVKATYDLASDVVAETEAGPCPKITASSRTRAFSSLKATLSGNPQDVKTAKLALQYLQGSVGLKADLTELTAGAPKADVSLCWSEGDLAAGVSGSVDTKAFPDPAALPGKLSYAVQSTGVVPDSTVALALSDAFDTVKASIVTKARPDPASRC